mmetsp:Transcript_112262/g.317544  ORF Transcript_112262/g.317544 Transcript_112262/m.317544 type:complete len:225 (+) Transcript_112262:436-1110(+)
MASLPSFTTMRALPLTVRASLFWTLYSREMQGKRLHARATSMSWDCERPSKSSFRASSSMFMTSKTSSTFFFLALSMNSLLKCGSCMSGLAFEDDACTIICESSMAKSAGVSQPQEEMTSTRPCSSRTACSRMKRWSEARSVVMAVRLKWALSSSWALVCGSLSFSFSTLTCRLWASERSAASSPERTGTASNSEAAQRMSRSPRRFVLSLTQREKVSMVVCRM